jgi:hypothetical protein
MGVQSVVWNEAVKINGADPDYHRRDLWDAITMGGATSKAMTTLADMNHLWPADHNATPWVATRDGSWTRMVGNGVNLNIPAAKRGAAGTCRGAS